MVFRHGLMRLACILYTPVHTDPNKSHFREGLGAFSTRGNCHPLFLLEQQIVSRTTYSLLRGSWENSIGWGFPHSSSSFLLSSLWTSSLLLYEHFSLNMQKLKFGLCFIFHFLKTLLMYNLWKLHTFVLCLDEFGCIYAHMLYHSNQGIKHIYYLQEFPSVFVFFLFCCCW